MIFDPIFTPALESVMVPKETYDLLYDFTESHSGHRTYIPDAKFVNYTKSVEMLERFLDDEMKSLCNRKVDDSTISIATQRFMNESSELWISEPIYHNRILKYMESAYQVPQKVKLIYEKYVSTYPQHSDAITYGVKKYLEQYMDHVSKEMMYLESYISGEKMIPLQESIDTDFRGYYMPEALGSAIAQIPGMIIAMVKKMLNSLTYALTEAGKSFANNILKDNAVNEEAIKRIYQVYQGKSKTGVQKEIRYPDPKSIHELRQVYSAGFNQFRDQMIRAIDSNSFKEVDVGVVQIIQRFQVVRSNQSLPANASFQEFRRAILSIANNIIIMSDFMKCLKDIDDALTTKLGENPQELNKALGSLDRQTQINRNVSQQNQQSSNESVEDDMSGLFIMNEKHKPSKKTTNPNPIQAQPAEKSSETDTDQNTNSVNSEQPVYMSNQKVVEKINKNKTSGFKYAIKADGSWLKDKNGAQILVKDCPYKTDENGVVITKDGEPVSKGVVSNVANGVRKGVANAVNSDTIGNFVERMLNSVLNGTGDSIAALINGMLGDLINQVFGSFSGESVSFMEADQPQPAETNGPVGDPNSAKEDEKSASMWDQFLSLLGINPDGKGNKDLEDEGKLLNLVKNVDDKIFGTLADKMFEFALNYVSGKDNQGEQKQSQQPDQQTRTQSSDSSTEQPKTESFIDGSLNYDIMNEDVIDTLKNLVAGASTINTIRKAISSTQALVQSAANGDIKQLFTNTAKFAGPLITKFTVYKTIGEVINMKNEENGVEHLKQEETRIKTDFRTMAKITVAIAGVAATILICFKNGGISLSETIQNAKLGKLPKQYRADKNIANTKQALNQKLPQGIINLNAKADQNIKNLWTYINGWLYGGMDIKGQKEKTVGIADIIDQEIKSLAPYVDMRSVMNVDISGAVHANRDA